MTSAGARQHLLKLEIGGPGGERRPTRGARSTKKILAVGAARSRPLPRPSFRSNPRSVAVHARRLWGSRIGKTDRAPRACERGGLPQVRRRTTFASSKAYRFGKDSKPRGLHGQRRQRRPGQLSVHRKPLPDLRGGDSLSVALSVGTSDLPRRARNRRNRRADRSHSRRRPSLRLQDQQASAIKQAFDEPEITDTIVLIARSRSPARTACAGNACARRPRRCRRAKCLQPDQFR